MSVLISDSDAEDSRRHGPLCCCEYIDHNRKRNHLVACCCNCIALDAAFDRLICCQPIDASLRSGMLLTLQDRLRMPWSGGARRFALTTALPVVLVPVVFLVAAQSFLATCIMAVFVPGFLYYMARYLGRTEPRTKFFLSWLICSVAFLWMLFELTVPLLEVLPEENFTMFLLMTISVLAFYRTKERAALNFIVVSSGSPTKTNATESTVLLIDENEAYDDGKTTDGSEEDDDDEDVDDNDDDDDVEYDCEDDPYSDDLHIGCKATCSRCRKYAPPRTYHCFMCRTCVVRLDHHNRWLDCCIGQNGYRLYFVGCVFGFAALMMAANLALTSICHPFLVGSMFGVFVFLPDDCSEVYEQLDVSLCFVAAVYALAMSAVLLVDCLRQVWQISRGITWAEYKRGHYKYQQNIFSNWRQFVCLVRG